MALKDYVLAEDMLPGGKGDDADPSEFDVEELVLGIRHEMEHTDDPRVALEVAMDHLTENPKYYTEMSSAEDFFSKEG